MKQIRLTALFLALLMSSAMVFSCSSNDGSDGSITATTTGDEETPVGSAGSSDSRSPADPIIVGDISFTLPHVPGDIPLATTTTTRRTTTTKKTTTTTTKKAPPRPLPPEIADLPTPEKETPVTGEEFRLWHESMTVVSIIDCTTTDFNPFNDQESPAQLIDHLDGFISDGEWTKMAGGASSGATVTVQVPKDTEAVAYAFVTANDNSQYGRTPNSWILYGLNTDPEDASSEDWVFLDYVSDGGMFNEDFTPFGYTIDSDKIGAYQYYMFEFLGGTDGELTAIQLTELYIYTE